MRERLWIVVASNGLLRVAGGANSVLVGVYLADLSQCVSEVIHSTECRGRIGHFALWAFSSIAKRRDETLLRGRVGVRTSRRLRVP